MTNYDVVLDKTIQGNTAETSEEFNLFLHESMSLKLDGDAQSTDLDVRVETVHDQSGGTFGEYDTFPNLELSAKANNSFTIPYNVADVNDGRVFVINNSSDDTDLTVKVGKTRGVQQ
jgi:hypothetical protein